MIEVAKNDFYEIAVDLVKNRLFLKVSGFWKSPEQVPNYVGDIRTAAEKLKRGYTVLTDLSTMKPPTTSVGQLHVEAQQTLVTYGLSKTAEVTGTAVLLEIQLKDFARQSSMTKAEFRTREEAEAWLDSK